MKEGLLQLRALIFSTAFLPIAAVLFLLATAGAGLWKGRGRRLLWGLSLVAVLGAFALGLMPRGERGQEWKEVLFNGQLL